MKLLSIAAVLLLTGCAKKTVPGFRIGGSQAVRINGQGKLVADDPNDRPAAGFFDSFEEGIDDSIDRRLNAPAPVVA